ncbi:MAG: hypothetical protein KIG98_00755, partial [Comamonas sp.]|nr:hypothetical protein [Comamonas sp.]
PRNSQAIAVVCASQPIPNRIPHTFIRDHEHVLSAVGRPTAIPPVTPVQHACFLHWQTKAPQGVFVVFDCYAWPPCIASLLKKIHRFAYF